MVKVCYVNNAHAPVAMQSVTSRPSDQSHMLQI